MTADEIVARLTILDNPATRPNGAFLSVEDATEVKGLIIDLTAMKNVMADKLVVMQDRVFALEERLRGLAREGDAQ